ncbi:MAG TPA: hypothetical protein VGG03_21375 [Thermoanaerobaculia bacterium]
MASSSFGEEPRSGRAKERISAQERAALAASIPRREAELAKRQREDVLVEVEKRAQEMGVRASVEELTDLLWQRAHLQIGLDKCRLGNGGAASCRAEEKALARVEARFRDLAGLSAREFQGGRRDTPPPADKIKPLSQAKSQTCTCALSVYSGYRWMNRYWGLECNNHASHGVCSNNVDSAHTAGKGAMTGDINLYFGSYHQYKECPDDHVTCFHGPNTANPGEWGNVCNCDTWHSQYYNPYGDWYGGDLSDSAWVHQVSTPYFTVAGSCDGAYVSVSEYIKENDPICCDDPMGTLWISVPVANGSGNSPGQASVQNCNGGSQSGAYPYCGTFGATIWVAYVCQTNGTPPPPPPTCDPQEEQACWDLGGNWDSSTCTCYQDPCYQYSAEKMPYCP